MIGNLLGWLVVVAVVVLFGWRTRLMMFRPF
jgi:hypothetical protein